MEYIIDISNKDGRLCAHLSDSKKIEGYLFSIIVPSSYKKPCEIFYKDYSKASNIFKGKYYITIIDDSDGELHCTDNYNNHCKWNIIDGNFFGDYIRQSYQETVILDMDKMIVNCRNEENDFSEIIRIDFMECQALIKHENSFRQPY